MPLPLANHAVALAEGRQLEELARMLEKEGASALRYPLLSILDNPDTAPVLGWLRDLAADRFALVVLMTGEALRRLMGFADREGMREPVIAALRRTRTVTRGPKPVKALSEIGLTPALVARVPTTDGVIDTLKQEALAGLTVGVTLYGEPNPELVTFLEKAGATPRPVMPYILAPHSDGERVAELIQRLARGEVSVLLFTSSSQVDRLFEVAKGRNLEDTLRGGLKRTRVAAVGPVIVETLQDKGARADIVPEQGFVMKNLVQLIKRTVAGT
jgi:uroporphyrinogen-III synthase